MRSPDHPVDRDLDVADLRRQPPLGSVKRGHGNTRGRRGLRRYLVSFMVALVLVLFSAVVWFAYQDLMPGGDAVPPLIRADAGELKRDPDERGGLPVVNEQSAVVQALDEPEGPVRVERIVPRESTAPRSTADVIPEVLEAEPAPEAEDTAGVSAQIGAPLMADAGAAAGVEANGDAAANGAAAAGDPLDTLLAEIIEGPEDLAAIEPGAGPLDEDDLALAERVPMPADGMALPGEAAEGVEALEAPATGNADATPRVAPVPTTEPATAAAPPTPPQPAPAQTAPTETTPAETAIPAATPAPAVATTRAATTPAAAPPAAPAAPPAAAETVMAALPSPALAPTFNGAFRVQLLAVRDEAAAAGAWAGLQQRFPSALGPLRSQVQQADIGGNTFFRLHAGPFADRSGALAVCDALQTQGADCFVVAPTS